MKNFFQGIVFALTAFALGGWLYLRFGFADVCANVPLSRFDSEIATTALHASPSVECDIPAVIRVGKTVNCVADHAREVALVPALVRCTERLHVFGTHVSASFLKRRKVGRAMCGTRPRWLVSGGFAWSDSVRG